jgi:hypothetical protein
VFYGLLLWETNLSWQLPAVACPPEEYTACYGPGPGMGEDSMETMVLILNIPQLRGKYGLNMVKYDDKFHQLLGV